MEELTLPMVAGESTRLESRRDRPRIRDGSTRPARLGDAATALPVRNVRHNGRWPVGLLGALGMILLIDRLLGQVPCAAEHRSRLSSSWQTAIRAASGPAAGAEILCFGDSLVKLGIQPRVLRARLGRSAYNLSVLGGQPPTSYLLLRRVLEDGHRPDALVVNFSPLLLGMDPRVNLEWWAGLINGRERAELACRANDPALAASLFVQGVIGSWSSRETIRDALSLSAFEARGGDSRDQTIELAALARNWEWNLGAQVAPRKFVPIEGSLPRPYDGPGWKWHPHPAHAYFVERFLAMAQERRIPVYWVLTPALCTWLERNTRVGTVGAYRRFVEQQVARFTVLTVLDAQRMAWEPSWFRDPIHLNRDGAVRLSMLVSAAIDRRGQATSVGSRWIVLDRDAFAVPDEFAELLEDLDQSRVAVNERQGAPSGKEGTRW
jgi:hypothetical protein